MQAVTINDAKENLPRLIEPILADSEPRLVVNDHGDRVILMPHDEFNSFQETLYLLSNPANASHPRQSVAADDSGWTVHQFVWRFWCFLRPEAGLGLSGTEC
ncbi:MAG: type II toxin-antitoxin system Phd/YefM family antitoxin [Planctomycetaceae bacterium]